MPSVVGLLEERDVTARRRVEELREEADHIAAELVVAEQDWKEWVIARSRVGEVLAPGADDVAGPEASQDLQHPDPRPVRSAARSHPADRRAVRGARGVRRAGRHSGRDPVTFGAAVELLVTERGWSQPAAGGAVLDRWTDVAPELVGKVTPVHFDAEAGRLDVIPASHACATQMRLFGPQLVDRINAKTGTTALRTIRVLPPRIVGQPQDAASPPPGPTSPTQTAAQVKTRAEASPGFQSGPRCPACRTGGCRCHP